MGRSIRTSTDGGASFVYTRGSPGGDDYHFLWIDPDPPERRITGSDQGAVVTVNDGESWSTWYNQPTGQFYRVAVDDRFPYWIYSGQQDSGTVALASRSDYGQLTFRDWHPPAPLPARAGRNRFVWNLRTDRPRALEYEYSIAAVPGADTPALPQGIFVLPGRYTARLTVDGKTLTQPLDVEVDPRLPVSREILVEQFRFYGEVVRSLERATDARLEVRELRERLEELARDAKARDLAGQLARFEGGGGEDDIAAIAGTLGSLATDVESADGRPTEPQREVQSAFTQRLERAIGRWESVREGPARAFDRDATKPEE